VLLKKSTITPFKDLYWNIRIQQRNDMLGIQSIIPKVKKAGYLLPVLPVLPLIPLKSPSVEEVKGKYIAFELKTREGHPSDATRYKK
jgi:hypothetical protein